MLSRVITYDFEGPTYFIPKPHNVTFRIGQTATLLCSVENLGNKTLRTFLYTNMFTGMIIHISAILIALTVLILRRRYNLSVSMPERPNDAPSCAHLTEETKEGKMIPPYIMPEERMEYNLQIHNIRQEDSGVYHCQISTKEKLIRHILLTVVEIVLSGKKYVSSGDTIRLICNVTGNTEIPQDVDWFRNGTLLRPFSSPKIHIRKDTSITRRKFKTSHMRNKEDQGYKNPAYIYDEGRGGGGPDSRSGSSTSSKSSMKIISTKLKGQGRRRWLTLGLILLIAIVIIIAVTTAIYFTRNGSKDSGASGEIKQTVTIETSTKLQTTTARSIPTTSLISKLTTLSVTTKSTAPTTKQHVTSDTTSETTTTTTTTTTTPPTTKTSPTTTRRVTTTVVTSLSKTTSDSSTRNITQTTFPTTEDPTDKKPGNLSVAMSEILYHPDEVKSITLRCEGRHQGDWRTLTIRRQFKDGYEPVAAAALNDENQVEVFKFYPNVTHAISFSDFEVTLTLTFDPFLCAEMTNFTCAMANLEETASTRANISIYMPEPVITLPHAIVEDRTVTLRCVTEVWGSSANIVWKFKPEYNTKFMNFSVQPVNNFTQKNCSTVINSTLEFDPTMYEDGANFRCEIKDLAFHPQVIQKTSSDVTLKIVPSNFCEGKRQFTIHPHPHGPCTLVVYCLDTGPLVYEIECEPGHCYDYVKTACVPADTL